ncbi:hypothetical protein D3C80_896070 [compost metagenome]
MIDHIGTRVAVVIAHLHIEALRRTFGNRQADRAKAENTQALAADRRADHPVPLATAGRGIGTGNIAHNRQQQGHGMVSHRLGIGASAVGHGDTLRSGGRQIDLLVTGADHADDFQGGQGSNFIGVQAQRTAGQYRIDLAAMTGNGLGTQSRGLRADQAKTVALQQGQVGVDRFYQHQYRLCHAKLPGYSRGGIMRTSGYWAKARPRPPGTPLLSVSCQGPLRLVDQLQPLFQR